MKPDAFVLLCFSACAARAPRLSAAVTVERILVSVR